MIKLNFVGATKSLAVFLKFENKCFNCDAKLTFFNFHLEHIFPRCNAVEYTGENIHEENNLCVLCESCNKAKGKRDAKEFYGAKKFNALMKIAKNRLEKGTVKNAGVILAKENPFSKFAKLFMSGRYHKINTCFCGVRINGNADECSACIEDGNL